MVAVARALAGDTRVLLLDEPFEGLAPAVVEELFEAFDRLRREIAIVIVDHHLDLALALSDRTVVLERGQVTHTGPSRALSRDLALRRQVLWRVIIPLSMPGLIAGSALIFVPVVGSFMEPRILGGRVGVTMGTVIEDQFTQAFNWPLGAALSFILLAVVLVILALVSPILRRAA